MRGIENSRQIRFLLIGAGVLLVLGLLIAYQLGRQDEMESPTPAPYVNATQMAEAEASATAVEDARSTKTQSAVIRLTITPSGRQVE